MKRNGPSTRRAFIQTAGAALAVPVVAAAHTGAGVPESGEPLEVRLARLEDQEAIRALNQEFVRRLNAGDTAALVELYADASGMQIDAALRVVTPDDGTPATIQIAADRRGAAASLPCSVQFEHEIGPSCTLVDMARLQGGGVVRHTERGVVEHAYVRRRGVWKIERSAYRAL